MADMPRNTEVGKSGGVVGMLVDFTSSHKARGTTDDATDACSRRAPGNVPKERVTPLH